jgi:hypothetical protein
VYVDRKFRLGHGRAFAVYVMGYTLGRTWIELMRTDDATHVAGVRINVWVSGIVFLAAAVYFFLARSRGEREDPESLRGKDAPPLDEPDDEAEPDDEDTEATDVKAKDDEATDDKDKDAEDEKADADEPEKADPKKADATKADTEKADSDKADAEKAGADAAETDAAGEKAGADEKASAKSDS